MTTRMTRCRHCQDIYPYHPSGSGLGRTNNDTYCPSCYAVILSALDSVPAVRRRVSLPVMPGTNLKGNVTIEDFHKERQKKMFQTMRVVYSRDVKIYDCTIDGVEYELWKNTFTGEEILAAEYDEEIDTKKIHGMWNGEPRMFKDSWVEEARKTKNEFWEKDRPFPPMVIRPMSPADEKIYYQALQIDTEKTLLEAISEESKNALSDTDFIFHNAAGECNCEKCIQRRNRG